MIFLNDEFHYGGLILACPWCGENMCNDDREFVCTTHGWFIVDIQWVMTPQGKRANNISLSTNSW